MPTQTQIQTRLDAYYAAELEILSAQEMRSNDKTHRMAELDTIRRQIDVLERQLARKQTSNAGEGSIGFTRVNLNRVSGST